MELEKNELEIKKQIGFVSGGIDYYVKKKIKTITGVTRRFYDAWDEQAYRRYMAQFELDENKTPDQLSRKHEGEICAHACAEPQGEAAYTR